MHAVLHKETVSLPYESIKWLNALNKQLTKSNCQMSIAET